MVLKCRSSTAAAAWPWMSAGQAVAALTAAEGLLLGGWRIDSKLVRVTLWKQLRCIDLLVAYD